MRAPWPLLVLCLGCPDRSLDRARALEEAGELREAAERYTDIARADPANLAAWDGAVRVLCVRELNVGECLNLLELELNTLGNVERHREALSQTLELRARARIENGLVDAALSDLERADRVLPGRSTVHSARARALFRAGRGREARAALDRAQALDPHNPEVAELARAQEAIDAEGFGGARTASAAR